MPGFSSGLEKFNHSKLNKRFIINGNVKGRFKKTHH